MSVCSYWKCPQCGKRHTKYFSYGPVVGSAGPYQTRHVYHRDVTCDCGRTTSGGEIVGGMHDDHRGENTEGIVGCIGILSAVIGIILMVVTDSGLAFWATLGIGIGIGALISRFSRHRKL